MWKNNGIDDKQFKKNVVSAFVWSVAAYSLNTIKDLEANLIFEIFRRICTHVKQQIDMIKFIGWKFQNLFLPTGYIQCEQLLLFENL